MISVAFFVAGRDPHIGYAALMALICQGCQTELVPQASYCHHCGRRVETGLDGRRLDVIRTAIVVSAVTGAIAWLLLFIDVETVIASGPILLLSGIVLIIACTPIRYSRGQLLGVLHCGICTLFITLVNVFDLSPHQARLPFISLGFLYLISTLPLAVSTYRHVPVKHDPNRCIKCGYMLYGLTTPRCPECGTPFDPKAVGSPPGSPVLSERET